MEIKCPMYMWDGFSGLEKHVEMLYTLYMYMYIHKFSRPFIVGNNFLFVFITHTCTCTLIAVFYHQLLKYY